MVIIRLDYINDYLIFINKSLLSQAPLIGLHLDVISLKPSSIDRAVGRCALKLIKKEQIMKVLQTEIERHRAF